MLQRVAGFFLSLTVKCGNITQIHLIGNHNCTFTLMTTLSRLPDNVSATWIGMALWAWRSASDWVS